HVTSIGIAGPEAGRRNASTLPLSAGNRTNTSETFEHCDSTKRITGTISCWTRFIAPEPRSLYSRPFSVCPKSLNSLSSQIRHAVTDRSRRKSSIGIIVRLHPNQANARPRWHVGRAEKAAGERVPGDRTRKPRTAGHHRGASGRLLAA